jgi:hypothetical protein
MAIKSLQLAQNKFHNLTPLDRGTTKVREVVRHEDAVGTEDMTPRRINFGIREVSFTPRPSYLLPPGINSS